MPRMASRSRRHARNVSSTCAALCFGALVVSATRARADDRQVVAPETVVHSAPFDVAPEIARLPAGERVRADDQPQGQWRRVVLADGRYGFVHDADTQHSAVPVAPAAAEPVAAAGSTTPSPGSRTLVRQQGSPTQSAGPHLLGVMFELFPVGTLSATSSTGTNVSADSVFAVGVAPFFDGALSPYFALGLSPQVIFRVKSDLNGGVESAKEYDLRARLTARFPASPRVRVFGRLSPAFSFVRVPAQTPGGSSTDAQGFLIDGTVGIEVAVLPNLFLISDIGYQAGFQSGDDGDLHTSYLHLGGGFAIGL